MQQVQLLNCAEEPLIPKKMPSSRDALWTESLPWTAFRVPSVPYKALRERG